MDQQVSLPGANRVDPRKASGVPRRLRRFLALDDFEPVARSRLPRQIYGYYAGAAERNHAHADNFSAFADLCFVPRTLADVSGRSIATALFGETYAAPFGIAPMGLSALSTFEGDIALAREAAAAGVPSVMSATSLVPLEEVAAKVPGRWFQAYLPGEDDRIIAMVDRVAKAGFGTFVLTVDVPVSANRENNVRTGFTTPLKPSLRLAFDGMTHPRWLLETWAATFWRRGVPHFENMDAFRGPPILSSSVVRAIGKRDGLAWRHVALIRERWRGRFLLKGILSAEDARLAREAGVDGIIVSNHGGRQLDGAAAPMRVLPEIAAAVPDLPVLLDGGVRRGTDVLKALALGARFVFIGRPFLFAAAAAGSAGIGHAIQLMKDEIDRDMAMLGTRTIAEVTAERVRAK